LIACDTNILIYAISPEDDRGRTAAALDLLDRLGSIRPILPLQVVGEYFNVARRRRDIDLAGALARIELIIDVHHIVASTVGDFIDAVGMSARYNLQYFDALILTVARRAGATMLLSEDMHDGLDADGIRVVNPFVAGNETLLAAQFGSAL
jgi:predicted nucleic acid-binding protein